MFASRTLCNNYYFHFATLAAPWFGVAWLNGANGIRPQLNFRRHAANVMCVVIVRFCTYRKGEAITGASRKNEGEPEVAMARQPFLFSFLAGIYQSEEERKR